MGIGMTSIGAGDYNRPEYVDLSFLGSSPELHSLTLCGDHKVILQQHVDSVPPLPRHCLPSLVQVSFDNVASAYQQVILQAAAGNGRLQTYRLAASGPIDTNEQLTRQWRTIIPYLPVSSLRVIDTVTDLAMIQHMLLRFTRLELMRVMYMIMDSDTCTELRAFISRHRAMLRDDLIIVDSGTQFTSLPHTLTARECH